MSCPRHRKCLVTELALLLLPLLSPKISFFVSASVIDHLPGFEGPLPFRLETGYVGVDEVNGAELFYYFIESERSPSEDPLILWLTGGPRCSAFSGLVYEIGPLKFVTEKYDGSLPKLTYHPFSWTKVSNIIFVDSPIGSGFSFSRLPEGYNASDLSWSNHIPTFLTKFLHEHPRFIHNPLYIGGDSYARKIIPIVVQQIADGIEAGIHSFLNLKGYVVGNPVTGDKIDTNSQVPYAHGMGIISNDFFKRTQGYCEGQDYASPTTGSCAAFMDTFNEFLSEIDKTYVLDPHCTESARPGVKSRVGRTLTEDHLRLLDPPLVSQFLCKKIYGYELSYYWANSDAVRRALRIKKGSVGEWLRCNKEFPYTYDVRSSIQFHGSTLTKGYRALIYSGDHDLVIPFVGTQEWVRSLNFEVLNDRRSWHVGGQVAGYVTAYSNNLTFATVKGGGHTAPEYRPKQCLAMLERWLSYQPL